MKVLEGYVDDGKAAPLANVSTVVTVVGAGTVITSGITDADGHWYFDGLPEGQEYFVNVIDVDGNAVVRGPWSGEVRDVWVRDRLAIPDTAQAALPNGGQTTVGGLPLALSADAGNTLEWRATGLWATGGGMSQAAADLRYEPIDTAWTKAEADARYEPFDTAYTKAEADARYEPFDSAYTKTEADARYTQGGITQAAADLRYEPFDSAYTKSEADARYEPLDSAYTKAEDDARFVNLAGGSVLTGLLGPTTTNTRDLGTTALRWRALYGMTADLTTSLTVASKPVVVSPTGGNVLTWDATGLYVPTGGGGIDLATANANYVNVTGDTMSGDLSIIRDDWVTVLQFTYADSKYPTWRLGQAGGSQASPTNTVAGAPLGKIDFQRRVSGAWSSVGDIQYVAQGTAAASNWATQMRLTTGTSAGTVVERLRVDENGIVKVNPLTDPALPAGYGGSPGLLVQHEGAHYAGLSLARASSNDAFGEFVNFYRARGTFASKVAVANADTLAQLSVFGWTGSTWQAGAVVQANVTGTVTTTAIPSSLVFFTADSAGTLAARMSIGPDGATSVTSAAATGFTLAGPMTGALSMAIYNSQPAVNGWLIGHQGTAATLAPSGALHIGQGGIGTAISIRSGDLRVGIGGMAVAGATAQLDVQSTAAATPALLARAHASTANTLAFFQVVNTALNIPLGANNLGLVTDISTAATSVTTVSRVIKWYTPAGTLLGYTPIYSSAA